MDSLFHFVLAIIACMAVGLHRKHGLRIIVLISFFAVLIDIDHFIFAGQKYLHNIWLIAIIPIILFFIAYWYEHKQKKRSIRWQTYSLLLLVVMISHAVADYFSSEGLMLFYPFSKAVIMIPSWLAMQLPNTPYAIISQASIALLIGFVVILLAHFIEDFIYFVEKKQEPVKTAIKDIKREF